MKQLFLLILLSIYNVSFSQNWALVNDTTNYFFDYSSNLESGFTIVSTSQKNNQTIHKPNQILVNGNGCDSLVPNLFGSEFILSANRIKQINMPDISNGVYLLELKNNSNIITRKLVVNR